MALVSHYEKRKPLATRKWLDYHPQAHLDQRLVSDPVYRWLVLNYIDRATEKSSVDEMETLGRLADNIAERLQENAVLDIPISLQEVRTILSQRINPTALGMTVKEFQESRTIATFEIEQEAMRRGIRLNDVTKDQLANLLSWLAIKVSKTV